MKRIMHALLDSRVAAGWSELRPDQFARIGDHLSRYQGVALQANITWVLLDLSWRTPRKLAAFMLLNAEGRHRLTQLAEPFMVAKGLVDTLLPTLPAGRTTLHCAHTDLLNQVDTEEWGSADAYFLRYNKTKDISHLRHMAAVLYAPADTTRERRLQPDDLSLYERIPEGKLRALHLMWSGHRTVLQNESPWVFRNINQKKAARRNAGWGDVIRSLAGGKFGPYTETKRTEARVFLRELNDAIEQDTRSREAAAKAKRA